MENYVGGSTLIFDARHKKLVVGDIGIGTAIPTVLEKFGEPGFTRWEYNLIGYKTVGFYIAFAGENKVEQIYLSRRYPQGEADDIFPIFLASEDPESFPFDEWNMKTTQLWRGTMTNYSPDGLCIWSDFDEAFNFYYPAYIYRDYTGRVAEDATEDTGFFFQDVDYPEIYAAIEEEKTIREKLAAGLGPEFYSPINVLLSCRSLNVHTSAPAICSAIWTAAKRIIL